MESPPHECPNCRQLQERGDALERDNEALRRKLADIRQRLGLNSRNSSKPPSSDPPETPPPPKKPPTGRKRGGQPGHPGHRRQLLPLHEGDERTHVRPDACRHCGADIPPDAPLQGDPRAHQVIDLPERLFRVHQYDLEDPCCPCCGKVSKAQLPEGVPQGMFAPRMPAFIAMLVGRFRISRREAREFLQLVVRLPVSLGTISNAEQRVSQAIAPAYDEALQAANQAPTANADETSWPVAHRLAWLWVFVTKAIVVFRIARTRNRAAFEALAGDFAGVLISDRWCAYTNRLHELWQICWAHLKRDF